MFYNLTKCTGCLQRLLNTTKFVRFNSSHYAALGLPPTATQKEIRDAYIKLSKEHHPDQNQQDKDSHEKFVKINTAYEVLSKETSKKEYDIDMTMQNQPRKAYTGNETSYRPPNYNPYSNQQPKDDPFSFYNYESYQRQSDEAHEGEEKKVEKKVLTQGDYEEYFYYFMLYSFCVLAVYIAAKFAYIYANYAYLQHKLKVAKEEVARRNEMKKKQGLKVTKEEKKPDIDDMADVKNLSLDNKSNVKNPSLGNKSNVKNLSSDDKSNVKNQNLNSNTDLKSQSIESKSNMKSQSLENRNDVRNRRKSLKEKSLDTERDVKIDSVDTVTDLKNKMEGIRKIKDLKNKSLDDKSDVKLAGSISS